VSEYRISPDGAGQRLDKYVRRMLPRVPLSAIYRLIRTKKVRVNGQRTEEAYLLQAGDVVLIRDEAVSPLTLEAARAATRRPPRNAASTAADADAKDDVEGDTPTAAAAESGSERRRPPVRRPVARRTFEVLHEDGHILVCNKPGGLAAHPGTGITGATLVDEVRDYLGEPPPGEFRPAPAHRLDRETSGVIVVAKTRQAIVQLAQTFTANHPRKVYLTLVAGHLPREGTIDIRLAEHQQSAASKAERGANMQEAITHYRLLAEGRDVSLVEVEIETGRTHQIRRHFAAIGHPVLGDGKHGEFALNRWARAAWGLDRMFLHAARLGLPHPVTGQEMTFRAPLPDELCHVLDQLEFELPAKFPRAQPQQPRTSPLPSARPPPPRTQARPQPPRAGGSRPAGAQPTPSRSTQPRAPSRTTPSRAKAGDRPTDRRNPSGKSSTKRTPNTRTTSPRGRR